MIQHLKPRKCAKRVLTPTPCHDDELLSDYMKGFWGYGATDASFWFVGMEEGGGNTFEEVEERITQWDKRGRLPLEDLYEYHIGINVPKWFQKGAPLQPTWNRLIRVLLSAKGDKPEREAVRSYQIERLGRTNGETCLLEFLPLPSPTTRHWHYGKYSGIPSLSNRDRYTLDVGTWRALHLTQLITTHQPKVVMFYGIGYVDWWKKVAKTRLIKTTVHNKEVYFGKLEKTAIAVTQHPVATGVNLEYFHEVGQRLAEI